MPRKKILLYCWESTDCKNWRKISFELLFRHPDRKYAVSSALHNFFIVQSIEELEDLRFKLPTDPMLTIEQKIKITRKIENIIPVLEQLEDLRILTYDEYAEAKHGLFTVLERLKQFR